MIILNNKYMRLCYFTIAELFSFSASAHHSRDHMMLLTDSNTVIAQSQQGSSSWISGSLLLIFLFIAFIRWWKYRR